MNGKEEKWCTKNAFRVLFFFLPAINPLRLSNYHFSHQKSLQSSYKKHMNKLLLFIHKTTNLLFSFEAFYFRCFSSFVDASSKAAGFNSNDLWFLFLARWILVHASWSMLLAIAVYKIDVFFVQFRKKYQIFSHRNSCYPIFLKIDSLFSSHTNFRCTMPHQNALSKSKWK